MPFNEGFRYLRNQIEDDPAILASPALNYTLKSPVIVRTDKSFLSEYPDNHVVNSIRRKRHRSTGLFCPKALPYKPFGDLKHTDTFEWVANHFKISPPISSRHYQVKGRNCVSKSNATTSSEAIDNKIRIPRATTGSESLPQSLQAGLSSINLHLSSNNQCAQEVESGSCFTQSVNRQRNQLKSFKKERSWKTRGHVEKFLKPPLLPHPHQNLPMLNVDACATVKLLDHQAKQTIGPNLFVALATVKFKRSGIHIAQDLHNEAAISYAKQKCLAKLKAIHFILCCVYNLRPRDLRVKEPLSRNGLEGLSNRLIHSPADQRSSRSGGTVESTRQLMRLSAMESHYSAPHDRHATLSSSGKRVVAGKHVTIVKEDCLSIAKVIPPWQRQVVLVDEEADLKLSNKPENKLRDSILAFQDCKNEHADLLRAKLKDRELKFEEELITKLEQLRLGANTSSELQQMRERAHYSIMLERAKESELPAWFKSLEAEVQFLPDSEGELKTALDKLKQFATIRLEKIPHALEKMCLIAMSLPIHKLCADPVCTAMKFILESIFTTSPKLFQEWLLFRHIQWHI